MIVKVCLGHGFDWVVSCLRLVVCDWHVGQ